MLEECSNLAHRRTKQESRHISLERGVFDDASIVTNKSIRIPYYGEGIHGIIWILLDKLSPMNLYQRHESEFLRQADFPAF